MKKLFKLFFFLLLIVGSFALYQVVPFFYYNLELKSKFRIQIRQAKMTSDAAIRGQLAADLEELGIPASASEIKIRRGDAKMEISLKYYEDLTIEFRGKKYFITEIPFNTVVSGYF